MRSRLTSRFATDVDELLGYVVRQNPDVAAGMADSIEAAIARCTGAPRLGVVTTKAQVYRYPIARYRLTLFYRLRPRKQEVEFLRLVRGVRVKRLDRIPKASGR